MKDAAVQGRVASILEQIGTERSYVNSLLGETTSDEWLRDALVECRQSLEKWHNNVLMAFQRWNNGGDDLLLRSAFRVWDSRPSSIDRFERMRRCP